MSNEMQGLRRIGTCENAQAQPEWLGPAIEACPAAATYVCAACGHLLCGAHANGHHHPASDAASTTRRWQRQAQAVAAAAAQVATAKSAFDAALAAAEKDATQVEQVRAIVTA